MNHAVFTSLLVLASSYAAMAATPTPVAWWSFAPSGDVPEIIEDISGHSFDAVILDSASVACRTDAVAPGGAALVISPIEPSGETRLLAAAALPELSDYTPFTLSAWIRIDIIGDVVPVLARTSDVDKWSNGFVLFLDGDGVPGFAVGSEADHAALADADHVLHPGEWHHLALVSNGGTTTLFVDGMENASIPFIPCSTDAPLAFIPERVGDSFSGALSDVRLFDVALTVGQIAELVSDSRPNGKGNRPAGTTEAETPPRTNSVSIPHIGPMRSSSPPPESSLSDSTLISSPILRVWTRMD